MGLLKLNVCMTGLKKAKSRLKTAGKKTSVERNIIT